MKITRNSQPVKASEEVVVDMLVADVSPYQCAIDNIYNAIECLGGLALDDDCAARDAIANLSVVLLDLKSK